MTAHRCFFPRRRRTHGPAALSELPELDSVETQLLRDFQQADVIDLNEITVYGPEGPTPFAAPHGVTVLSQTCDIVLPNRRTVQVAPLRQLPDGAAREARAGRRPRFVHVPQAGAELFADLEVVCTVAKGLIARLPPRRGVLTDEQARRFRQSVARRFGRFPFPDEVTPWLRPLEKLMASKSPRSTTPEGQALEKVTELRIEADGGWAQSPYDLTLVVLLDPRILPAFENDHVPDCPEHLQPWVARIDERSAPPSTKIAQKLVTEKDPACRYWLWIALAEAWAALCRPPADAGCEVLEAVKGAALGVDILTVDEYGYDRYRRSEALDLDHLSAPLPN